MAWLLSCGRGAGGTCLHAHDTGLSHVSASQVENPEPAAAYPAVFIMPASHSFFRAPGRASTLPVSLRRQAAVTLRLAVWENRPGGVLCVERAELNVAPFAAELEHLHLLDLQAAALQALQPLRARQSLVQ